MGNFPKCLHFGGNKLIGNWETSSYFCFILDIDIYLSSFDITNTTRINYQGANRHDIEDLETFQKIKLESIAGWLPVDQRHEEHNKQFEQSSRSALGKSKLFESSIALFNIWLWITCLIDYGRPSIIQPIAGCVLLVASFRSGKRDFRLEKLMNMAKFIVGLSLFKPG